MPLENVSNLTSNGIQHSEEIARVSIKIPPIWQKNVKIWLLQIEAQFATANITAEMTKFNYIIGSLEPDVAELLSDFLTKPLSNTPYTDLKSRIISEFEESETRKVTKLLMELELGDKKPNQLLRELQEHK